MYQSNSVRIPPKLWATIEDRAKTANLSPEVWLQRQVERTVDNEWRSDSAFGDLDSDVLYELALRHFRQLNLDSGQTLGIASALEQTIETGESHSVETSVHPNRTYFFQRRLAAVIVRLGEGAIRLPLPMAARLVSALRAEVGPTIKKIKAA